MAKPIEETPILKGKDAELFLDNMKKNEFKSISIKELDEMKANFNKLNQIPLCDSKPKDE